MPGEERSGRGAERCTVHPSQTAVATCDVCGRAMCLSCSVPVRGGTVGQECLAVALGPDAPPPEAPRRPPGTVARWVTVAAAAVVLLATALPWSRFGTGSGSFGAWGDAARWSVVAAVSAVVGIAAAVLLAARPSTRWLVTTVGAEALVTTASILAVVLPPAFTSPWLGPWIAAAAAVGAVISALVASRDSVGRNASRV